MNHGFVHNTIYSVTDACSLHSCVLMFAFTNYKPPVMSSTLMECEQCYRCPYICACLKDMMHSFITSRLDEVLKVGSTTHCLGVSEKVWLPKVFTE